MQPVSDDKHTDDTYTLNGSHKTLHKDSYYLLECVLGLCSAGLEDLDHMLDNMAALNVCEQTEKSTK